MQARGLHAPNGNEDAMTRSGLLGVVVFAGLVATQSALPAPGPPALAGSWRLVSYEEHRVDGTVTAVWGANPAGRLVYDGGGRMSVQLMDRRRKSFASEDRMAGTAEEIKQAFEGYLAYFGSYTVDAQAAAVVHHVEGASFPNLIGTDLRRSFVLSKNRLALSTPPTFRAGRTSVYVIVWERES